MNIKESCYLGNLATTNCNAEVGIKVAYKYEQDESNLKQRKPVHKYSIWLIKILSSTAPGLTWYMRSILPVATMLSLLQKNLLKILSAWCCWVGTWCLMFAHSGFPFYAKLRTRTFTSTGVRFALGSSQRYLLCLLCYRIQIELSFPPPFFILHIISLIFTPFSLSCRTGN